MDYYTPHPLIESLEIVRRRLNWMTIGLGVGISIISIITIVLLAILVDYYLDLNAVPRCLLILAGICSIGFVLRRWVIESAISRLTLNDIASRVEKIYPQYQDRLLSTVNFLSATQTGGSKVMRQRVVGEATRMASGLDMTQIIFTRPLWIIHLACGSAVLLLAALLATVNPSYIRIATSRFLTPFAINAWPRTIVIIPAVMPPTTVAEGQRIDFTARMARGDKASRKLMLHYQYFNDNAKAGGPIQDVYMTRGSDGIYHSALDARNQSGTAAGKLNAWVESGDGILTFEPIAIVPRLTIKHVDAVITAPSYAKQPPMQITLGEKPATIIAGSAIKLIAVFNKPLDQSRPVSIEPINSHTVPMMQSQSRAGDTATVTFSPADTFAFHLHATDTDGLPNLGSEEFEIIVREDQLPAVIIENPDSNLDCTPEASLPTRIVAEDDLGVNSLELLATRTSDQAGMEIPLVNHATALDGVEWKPLDATTGSQRFEARYTWELSTFSSSKLKAGDELECYASVADNYLLKSRTHSRVFSGKVRISIISQLAFTNKMSVELNAVSEQLAAVKQAQIQVRNETSNLQDKLSNSLSIEDADKAALGRSEAAQNSVASQTKTLANRLDELLASMDQNKSTDHELRESSREAGRLLNNAAENAMKDAAANLTNARHSTQRSTVIPMIATAKLAEIRADDEIQSALDRIRTNEGVAQTIQNIQALLETQQSLSANTTKATQSTLGKTIDELTPQQREELNQLGKAQADLADKTKLAVDHISRNAKMLSHSDASSAKAMAQAASSALSEDVTGQQTAAAGATRENQQSQAQTAQRQAEDGLKTMLAGLKQAQNSKQAELDKKADEQLQGIAVLIQHQASHNLDNLELQGGPVAEHAAALGQTNLFSQAGRDADVPSPATTIELLSSAQLQTEHDTRELATSTQSSPNGTEPAEHLTQAAENMARACASLRNRKFSEAFDPPQIQALSELLAAKQILEKQKQDADESEQDEQKQTIKQAYAELLVQQEQVNSRTSALDAMPRKSDGTLRRQDIVHLTQVTSIQNSIIEQTLKLDKPLSKLNSIIYSWANKDLIKNMTEVHTLLEGKQLGSNTQLHQKQVVNELHTLIDDLTLKPKKSPPSTQIADKAAGEPPPDGGPADMPTEVEVRLILDLQLVLNRDTVSLSQHANSSNADLAVLGNREGELRELLNRLIQQASHGKSRLRPDRDFSERLPEEIAGSTTRPHLKDEDPTSEDLKDLNLIGTRMSKVRQRLNVGADAGSVTLNIQSRIVDNLTTLLQQVRKKESPKKDSPPQNSPKPKKKPATQEMQSGVDTANSNSKGKGAAGASLSKSVSGGGGDGTLGQAGSEVARQQIRMWGAVTPRERDAVIESQSEGVLDKYKDLVDDYYREMSTQEDNH